SRLHQRLTALRFSRSPSRPGVACPLGALIGRLARGALTPDGRRCLVDHDGDVRAWQEANRRERRLPRQRERAGCGEQRLCHADHGRGRLRYRTSDPARYARAVSTLLAELDNLSLPDDRSAELRLAAEEVAAEAASQAGRGQASPLGGVIVKGLGAVTTSAFGGSAARYIVDLLSSAS
ncbi:MAG: hypothetical protein M3186_06425, partial [Actinomycetota bacterium]|nr:hypothetical protein [Actinomycetota bacterium]